MNCRFTTSRISSYIDGELSGADMLKIRQHLSACESCSASYESARKIKELVGKLPEHRPDPAIEEKILSAIAGIRMSEPAAVFWPSAKLSLAFGAAAVIAFAAIYFSYGNSSGADVPVASSSNVDAIVYDQSYNQARGSFSSNVMPAGLEARFGGR